MLDTNVLVSAAGWRGAPRQCLDAIRSGAAEGITCTELITELEETLVTKLRYDSEQLAAALTEIVVALQVVSIPRTLHSISLDPDDDIVIECAVVGQATHIVTGDKRHLLPLSSYAGIAIITPTAMLDLLRGA